MDYQDTHPWLTFQLDLRSLPHHVWICLGEIQEKIETVAGAILAPGISESLHSLYLAKGVHATTAIEGNSLSEEEVQERIEKKTPLPPSLEYQGAEIDNIVRACNRIREQVLSNRQAGLTPEDLLIYHDIVLDGLPLQEGVIPGRTRKHSVVVRGVHYRGVQWHECDALLDKLCRWLNTLRLPDPKHQVLSGVIRAVMVHLYLAWIHPFGDGNGRTARLAEFHLLLAAGVPTIAAHLLSNHYNKTRSEYYRHLDLASKSGGNVIPFLEYAVVGMEDGLDTQLSEIREFQFEVVWRDYIYWSFRAHKHHGPSADRQRMLVLAMWSTPQRVYRSSELRRLTPELAEQYAGKTDKTISRDVNKLVEMGLLRKDGRQIEDCREVLHAFRSDRHRSESLKNTTP